MASIANDLLSYHSAHSKLAQMKIVFAYEHLQPPFDEGVKIFAMRLFEAMGNNHTVSVIRNLNPMPSFINKLLLLPRVLAISLASRADRVVYIPEGAMTFSGIVKSWILRKFLGARLSVIGVQRRSLTGWQRKIVRRLTIGPVFTLSTGMADDLRLLGIRAQVINAGIDQDKFAPHSGNDLDSLRSKYGIDGKGPLLLHVGHIKESRNIRWLLDIGHELSNLSIVLVGSTATEHDGKLLSELRQAGIIVLNDFVPDIRELYQLATWYIFPVLEEQGAMEIPLSVLEAMAVGLPVITTRFGRLPELFQEDSAFRYVANSHDVIDLLRNGIGDGRVNRAKVRSFTWQATADLLLVVPTA